VEVSAGEAEDKMKALNRAGVPMAQIPWEAGKLLKEVLP
jgi:succinyl-CoA synthetase alpha subunit